MLFSISTIFLNEEVIKGWYIFQWPQSWLSLIIMHPGQIKHASILIKGIENERYRIFFGNYVMMVHWREKSSISFWLKRGSYALLADFGIFC